MEGWSPQVVRRSDVEKVPRAPKFRFGGELASANNQTKHPAMGLSDFERELSENKAKESHKRRHRSRSRDRDHRHSKVRFHPRICTIAKRNCDFGPRTFGRNAHELQDKHRHHSSRHHRSKHDDEEDSKHQHKRSRHHRDSDERTHSRRSRKDDRSRSPAVKKDNDEDEWVEKEANTAPPGENTLDDQLQEAQDKDLRRDDWMQAPSALNVDYVQRKQKEPPSTKTQATRKDYELKFHENELNHHLRDLKRDEDGVLLLEDEPAQHEVDYEFGDSGSQWRMTKLKGVYRQAQETEKSVEEIAFERYGDLRAFDDAREEEIEMDRRKMYGKEYVGKIKPSGELFQERKLKMGIRRESHREREVERPRIAQGEIVEDTAAPKAAVLDQTALNKLKAQMMKAKLRNAPNASRLEAEYNQAVSAASNRKESDVVVLGAMDSRILAGSRKGEVTAIDNKRGRERGLVEENEDMSIEDMVRQERRTKGRNEGMAFAERIAKDAKFDVSQTPSIICIDTNQGSFSRTISTISMKTLQSCLSTYKNPISTCGIWLLAISKR